MVLPACVRKAGRQLEAQGRLYGCLQQVTHAARACATTALLAGPAFTGVCYCHGDEQHLLLDSHVVRSPAAHGFPNGGYRALRSVMLTRLTQLHMNAVLYVKQRRKRLQGSCGSC